TTFALLEPSIVTLETLALSWLASGLLASALIVEANFEPSCSMAGFCATGVLLEKNDVQTCLTFAASELPPPPPPPQAARMSTEASRIASRLMGEDTKPLAGCAQPARRSAPTAGRACPSASA